MREIVRTATLVKIHMGTFRCNAALTNAFLRGYRELRPICFSLDKCKVYGVLDRFSAVGDFLDWEQVNASPSGLTTQLNLMWESVEAGRCCGHG